jgi:hypothetical protein
MKPIYILILHILVQLLIITLGSFIFSNIEKNEPENTTSFDKDLSDLNKSNIQLNNEEYWSYSDSAFFIFTILTTIGFF